MLNRRTSSLLALFGITVVAAAGCGGSKSSSGSPSATNGSQGGKQAEAKAAATGDIPDSQAFLTFTDKAAGYKLTYPEGWAQSGSGSDVTFKDKNNLIHVVISKGSAPTPASVKADLAKLKSSTPSLEPGAPQAVSINGAPVIKVTYKMQSAPNSVTGKREPLTVDRYVYAHKGKLATVDLGTAIGVDNVDAYRMISKSFKWL